DGRACTPGDQPRPWATNAHHHPSYATPSVTNATTTGLSTPVRRHRFSGEVTRRYGRRPVSDARNGVGWRDPQKRRARCWPIAKPRGIGTALPIWRAIDVLEPTHL